MWTWTKGGWRSRITAAGLCLATAACAPFGPSCRDETGDVLRANATASPGATVVYTVISPKHSNLIIRVSWNDPAAIVDLHATITNCGAHTGCQMLTSTPSPPLGGTTLGSSRQMLVDGTQGKTYRIEVVGDPSRDTAFALAVTYDISCES